MISFMLVVNFFAFAQAENNVKCKDFYELMQVADNIGKSKKIVKYRDKMRRTYISKEISSMIMQSDTIQVIYNPLWIDFIIGSFQEYVLADSISYELQVPGELAINVKDSEFSEMICKIRDHQYLVGKTRFPEFFGGSEIFYYYKFVRQHDNHFGCYRKIFFRNPMTFVLYKITETEESLVEDDFRSCRRSKE